MGGTSATDDGPVCPSDVIVIKRGGADRRYWGDLWRHRELIYFLVWRDVILRYKQTVVGIAWALLRPLVTTLVMVIVFGKLVGLGCTGIPYSLVVLTGLLGWQLFAGALIGSSSSLVCNANLITKIYFPRLIIPFSSMLHSVVDYFISCVVLGLLMIWFRFNPGWRALALPGLTCLTLLAATGFGLWFAALNVRFRDVNNVVGILMQVGIYISPVAFSSSIVPEQWRLLYSLNPMAGIIDGYRWALLHQDTAIYWPGFVTSLGMMTFLLVSGLWYFRKAEWEFADVI
jgi:lipopolysaccharide transport system permease protein